MKEANSSTLACCLHRAAVRAMRGTDGPMARRRVARHRVDRRPGDGGDLAYGSGISQGRFLYSIAR